MGNWYSDWEREKEEREDRYFEEYQAKLKSENTFAMIGPKLYTMSGGQLSLFPQENTENQENNSELDEKENV